MTDACRSSCVQISGCWSSPCCCARCLSAGDLGHRPDGLPRQGPGKPADRCAKGKPVGSRLIAQPFTADEYFQPRPSAARYNAAASGASNWAANNYLLRDRVARQLGPIVKYRSGPKKGQPVAPDIESWFQKDQLRRKAGDRGPMGGAASDASPRTGSRRHDQRQVQTERPVRGRLAEDASDGRRSNGSRTTPTRPSPSPRTWPCRFFASFSKDHPGTFPSHRRAQDGGRQDREANRAGQGRARHPDAASSTCGCRSIPTPTWSRSPPTW